MDRFDDDTLAAELRALRPTPRPEFTAELDERVAAGFPRCSAPSAAATPLARLAGRRPALSLRPRLVPALAVVLAALLVTATVVAVSQSGGGGSSSVDGASLGTVAGGASSSGEAVHRAQAPPLAAGPGAEAGAGAAAGVEARGPSRSHDTALNGRDIERSAYVVLGTKPGEVSAAAAKVYEAVHAANGVVLHSSVRSGRAGAPGADFDLLIPSAKLGEALAAFSAIAEVRERHDATRDITAPTVSAAEELRDSNAAIEGLLKELGGVETESERKSVEARLREERRRHAAIRARLDRLDQRASMSEVTVRIVTDRGAGAAPAPGSGSWGVGAALHDAGHILAIAASVLLIALAVLAPIGLIALALWLANRLRLRRLRERALG